MTSSTIIKLKDIINNVTTEVLKGLKVDTAIADMEMNLGCDIEVYNEAVRLCNLVKEEYALSKKVFDKKKIPVCQACSFTDINQDVIVTINSQDIENNIIANNIQEGVNDKLTDEITYLGIKDRYKADNMTIVRDIITNNFNTELVNNTIKNFAFKQSINILNMQAKNINQILVATVVSNTIINNLINTNQKFNSAIKVLDGTTPIDPPKIPKEAVTVTVDYTNYYYLFIVFFCLMLYSYYSKDEEDEEPRKRRRRQRRYY